MADFENNDQGWIAGFEGDRRIVVSKVGPYLNVFQRPRSFSERFYHRVYSLPIEQWNITIPTPQISPLCSISCQLKLNFQATLQFAKEHIEHIDRLNDYIKSHFEALILDATRDELRSLESPEWIDQGTDSLSKSIESLAQEILAIRNVQSRCDCDLVIQFNEFQAGRMDAEFLSSDPLRKIIALKVLKKRRESSEEIARLRHEQELLDHRIKLEQQEKALELLKIETALIRQRQSEELEQVKAGFALDEARELNRIESELRMKNSQLEHEAELREIELQAKLEEKDRHENAYKEVQLFLQKEIEILAMERQRLSLEEEIHKTKKARSRGWVFGVKPTLTKQSTEN